MCILYYLQVHIAETVNKYIFYKDCSLQKSVLLSELMYTPNHWQIPGDYVSRMVRSTNVIDLRKILLLQLIILIKIQYIRKVKGHICSTLLELGTQFQPHKSISKPKWSEGTVISFQYFQTILELYLPFSQKL